MIKNKLLSKLPEEAYERVRPALETVSLALGDVLYESDGRQDYVYFPSSAIVSLLYMMENGRSAEIAVTGYEGVVGIALFMGGGSMPSRAVIQRASRG